MRYHVELDPNGDRNPIEVDVRELPSGALDVRVGGAPITVDVARIGAQLSVIVNGRVVDLTTEGAPPELGAIASGHRSYVHVESERQRAASQAHRGSATAASKTVKSPMPGRIIKVLVAVGDQVVAGQALLVVEAMKMENEVKAKADSVVAQVHVAVGATVEGGAKLITLA
jgi:glutaconyl-CoA/methylmalonyl-CoA decarboxylase subunit gamma